MISIIIMALLFSIYYEQGSTKMLFVCYPWFSEVMELGIYIDAYFIINIWYKETWILLD